MFCGETGEAWRSFAVIPMERAGPWEEARGWQSESPTELATFGHEFSYLKGWLADKPWLFRLGRLVASSFTMNGASHVKKNSWQYSLPVVTCELLSQNSSCRKGWQLPHRDFPDKIGSHVNKRDFLGCCIMKCFNIWKIDVTHGNSSFKWHGINTWHYRTVRRYRFIEGGRDTSGP